MKKAGERMKPRIFIGSSKESVKIAEKVKSLLDGEYVCQLWCDNFFDLGQCTYHELLKKSLSFDYAIFIGGKDDYVRRESDRTHKYAARDNVYLEFGLYAGILTYARCFFLIQEGCQIASDLLGVNVVFFDKMQDLSKKILTITEKIQKEQKVARISLLPSTSLAVGYFENFLKPVSQAIQKLDEVCIAGKKYDVKNSDKRLEVAIPAKVSEDLRILKNFKIRAIVLMGNKTFGATGTNTVVLFLEKYNEPPKKADLIEDSIDAVFNGCNLDGWEDKAILEQYLKKIDVSSEVYERFLSEAVDIGDIEDKYFLKYKEAFLALSKTKEKQKQKTFGKLSEKEQKKLLTKQYYQYVKKIEREKMKYFSFVYDQRTLIVAAPDDNKGQEKFLGYKWSNRKGQEGIQIIDEGGMLYDAENRMSDRTIASLIRKMFNGEEVSLDDLEEYYYYLHTKDMISFSEVYFNKAIKTTKTRLLKDDPGLTAYSLSDEKTFDITIGDRVLSEEIVSGGRVPVYSANVYEEFGRIDKENMKDYSRPSVIWGIDGDWMVNIIPAGVPFYPTDHCGVLRIKTEKILPEYMMYALQAEGEYERFSRNNRASAQRIRSLVVQAPETKIQKNIIDELKALDDKINGQNAEIEKYENSIRTKFDQIFHLEEFISDGVFSKYEGYSVEDLCIDGRGRVINQQYIENHKGPYPVYSSQTTNDGIFGSIDTFDFDGEYITWTTDGAKAGTVFYRNGKFNCTNVCGTLKAKNDKVNMRYLAYLLNRIAYKFVSRVGNNKLMNDAMKKIVVPVPKRQLQDEFADFVQSVEKSKFECIGKKEKFEIEKDTFVHKYFR